MDWSVALIVACTLANVALTAVNAWLRFKPRRYVPELIDADTCEAVRSFGLTPRREDLDELVGVLGRGRHSS